jgi:glutamate synthase (ferredoxin)
MADIEELSDLAEIAALKALIERHVRLTGSSLGKRIIAGWAGALRRFVKVMPRDYRRMRDAIEAARKGGLDGKEALMAAFEANNHDLARVSGN